MQYQLVEILKQSDHFKLGGLKIMGQRNFLIKNIFQFEVSKVFNHIGVLNLRKKIYFYITQRP